MGPLRRKARNARLGTRRVLPRNRMQLLACLVVGLLAPPRCADAVLPVADGLALRSEGRLSKADVSSLTGSGGAPGPASDRSHTVPNPPPASRLRCTAACTARVACDADAAHDALRAPRARYEVRAQDMQAMLPDGAPQDLVMLPEIRAPEDERHARLLERMRARLPSHRSTSRSTSRDAMQVLRACN